MIGMLAYGLLLVFGLHILWKLSWKLWTAKFHFIPVTPCVPWLGGIPYFKVGNSHKIFKQLLSYHHQYKDLYLIWLGPVPTIRVASVKYLEPLLRASDTITKSFLYSFLHDWLGTGLLTSTGDKWKRRRTALTPAFHFGILPDFLGIFETNVHLLISKLRNCDNDVVEVQSVLSLAALDVICEATMGVKIDALNSTAECHYLKSLSEIKRIFMWRIGKIYLWPQYFFKRSSLGKEFFHHVGVINEFTTDVINKRIQDRKDLSVNMNENDNIVQPKRAFLDTLLDLYNEGGIDMDGIREEVETFMFEGHDTTSSALSWILYEVGRHEDIQQSLFDEVSSVSMLDCSLMEKLRKAKYLENVIKEGLRLHPPVGEFGRLFEKDKVIGGDLIPAGTELIVNTHATHMNPEYWGDNAELFDPTRFESEDFIKRNPYCYIPFSAGPRNCIGQKFAMLELKTFLFHIIINFELKSMQEPSEMEESVEFVTQSSNGIFIKFKSR